MKKQLGLIFELTRKDRKDCWCFAPIFVFTALFRSEKCNFAHESGLNNVSKQEIRFGAVPSTGLGSVRFNKIKERTNDKKESKL